MPAFRNRATLDVWRGVKAFFNLEIALTRGEMPDPDRELRRLRKEVGDRDRRIEDLARRLSEKDAESGRMRRASGRRSAQRRDPLLLAAFGERGPWITKYTINGASYGGSFDGMNDARVDHFFGHFPDARSIMELGSLEGGHTFNLAGRPGVEAVLGLEGREENVEKARFVQNLLGITNVEFAVANLETADLSSFGRFDAVFCSGLLYHLPEPWKLIEQTAHVSPNLFVWTHYARGDAAKSTLPALKNAKNATREGHEGWEYAEHGLEDPLSGMSPTSFWPTLDGLQTMLRDHGYAEIRLIQDNPNNPHGPAITLSAKMP